MRIFADFSGTIAIPAVGAALLGKWLDDKYGTEPLYLILLLIVAFTLTAVLVYKKAQTYRKIYDRLNNETKETH
jgi:F0F1-type ATP synthase assembly protein I